MSTDTIAQMIVAGLSARRLNEYSAHTNGSRPELHDNQILVRNIDTGKEVVLTVTPSK